MSFVVFVHVCGSVIICHFNHTEQASLSRGRNPLPDISTNLKRKTSKRVRTCMCKVQWCSSLFLIVCLLGQANKIDCFSGIFLRKTIVANRPDLVGTLTIFTPLSRVPPDCTNCPDTLLIWIDSTSYAS